MSDWGVGGEERAETGTHGHEHTADNKEWGIVTDIGNEDAGHHGPEYLGKQHCEGVDA